MIFRIGACVIGSNGVLDPKNGTGKLCKTSSELWLCSNLNIWSVESILTKQKYFSKLNITEVAECSVLTTSGEQVAINAALNPTTSTVKHFPRNT